MSFTQVIAGADGDRYPAAVERRKQLFQAIIEYAVQYSGNAPSLRELVEMTDYTAQSVVKHNLEVLAKRGLIRLGKEGQARHIQVVGAVWIPPAWWDTETLA